jgi:hypothetical protein
MKIRINESQYKYLVEQTNPPVTTPVTPAAPLSPQQIKDNQREALKKKREEDIRLKQEARDKRAAENEARLAPIRAATQKRIENWILSHPGKTEKDYWKWQESMGGSYESDGGDGGGRGLGRFLSPCKGGRCPGLNTGS